MTVHRKKNKRGFTLIELLVVVAIIALLISILLPSLNRAREQARRIVCSSALKAISSACLFYAEANRGMFPTLPSAMTGAASSAATASDACYRIGYYMDKEESDSLLWSGTPRAFKGTGSNPRCYFKLLMGGDKAYLQPKQFICPTAVSTLNHLRQGTNTEFTPATGVPLKRYDFDGSRTATVGSDATPSEMTEFSFSFQVAIAGKKDTANLNEVRGGPISNSRDDPRKALAADRNPYSNSVTSISATNTDGVGYGSYEYSASQTAGFRLSPKTGTDATAAEILDKTTYNNNSRNHNQEGQNVVYIDGHGKWNSNALAGADEDFIWGTLNETMTAHRIPLTGGDYGKMRSKNTWSTDSLLIP